MRASADPASRTGIGRSGATVASPLAAAFAVAVFILSTGAFFVLRDAEDASSPLVLLLWLSAYAVATTGLLDELMRQRQLRVPVFLLAFVLLALLSTVWSVAPDVSLRRGIALAGTVIVGLFLALKLSAVDVFEALRRAATIVAVASLVLYLVGDPRALDEVHQTLRGVVATKNTLGRVSAVGLIATATVVFLDFRRWRRCALSAATLLLTLALTDSAGGAALALVGVLAVGGAAAWRFDRGRSAAPAVGLAALGVLVLLLPIGLTANSLLDLLGRDATLTGRTAIWTESLHAAAERPLLGSGYGAFWALGSSDGSAAAARISTRLAEPVANAHNGLLDVMLDVGIVGVGLTLLVLSSVLVRGLRDARSGHTGPATLRLVVLGLLLVSTAVEGGLLLENALLTVLLATAAGYGSKASRSPTTGIRR